MLGKSLQLFTKSFKQGARWFWVVTISLLIWLTYRDFVVNSDMYFYGELVYSLDWFLRYAVSTYGEYISIATLLSVVYWFTAPIANRCKTTAITIWVTIFGLWVGGFLDLIWFLMEYIWRGKLLGLFDVWWWFPQYWLLGIEWTTLHQLVYTAVIGIGLILLWRRVMKEG